jgi:hypothetical protein
MTGNKSDPEYIYLHQRQQNVLKLWTISVFESCNQEIHGNACYTFHKQKNISVVYNKRKSYRKTENKLFLIESRVSIFKTMYFEG